MRGRAASPLGVVNNGRSGGHDDRMKRTMLIFALGRRWPARSLGQTLDKMEGSDALIGLRGLMVPPIARSETTNLIDAGTIDTDGYTHMTLNFATELKGSAARRRRRRRAAPPGRASRSGARGAHSVSCPPWSTSPWRRLRSPARTRWRPSRPSKWAFPVTGSCSTTPRARRPRSRFSRTGRADEASLRGRECPHAGPPAQTQRARDVGFLPRGDPVPAGPLQRPEARQEATATRSRVCAA